ncbi:putative Calcium release-activated calcium channel protein 1 [Hypsibius exemplaris]|uniref:Calcium release-activated calcium channel protein 1 n=1 Tax=Hypsibius exemplaris TaxID=2072580 RepID=A0A1W0WPN7_HYPEX|nr:putative Calcium release-activated calcium channel protein 1 [Hypsibius exemplaris]
MLQYPNKSPWFSDDFYRVNRGMSTSLDTTAVRWKHLQLSRAKLKASSRTSALLSGFAMVAMVEVSLDKETLKDREGLVIAFCVCTTLLVAVHMLSLMISTCILPNLEAASSTRDAIVDSPHVRLKYYIEASWICSTLLGLLLFLVDIGLLCWVKFYPISAMAAYAATAVLAPLLFLFLLFAVHFYRSLADHSSERVNEQLDDLNAEYEMLKSKSDVV